MGYKLLHLIQREYEGPPLIVMHEAITLIPDVVGESSYGFAVLVADEYESVLLVVALFVESGNTEVIFGGLEYLFTHEWFS